MKVWFALLALISLFTVIGCDDAGPSDTGAGDSSAEAGGDASGDASDATGDHTDAPIDAGDSPRSDAGDGSQGSDAMDVAADDERDGAPPDDATDATTDASTDATALDAPSDGTPGDLPSTPEAPPTDAAADGPPEAAVDAGPAPRAQLTVTPGLFRRGTRTTVALDGTRSTGAMLSYRWILGGGTVISGSLDGPSVTVTVDGNADLPVGLQVTNAAGSDTARSVVVANAPPVAAALDRLGAVDTPLRMDASGTVDREGDALTYAWRVTSSVPGSAVDLAAATTATPTFRADRAGTYTVELVASDPHGPGAAATARVTLSGRALAPPRVTLTATPTAVAVGGRVTLAVREVADTTVARRSLTVDGAAITLDARGDGAFTPTRAGAFEASAEVTDAEGNVGAARVTFTAHASADNGPPTVSLTAPAAGAELEASTTVTGSVTDSDLVRWDVAVQRAGGDRWTTIASGTSPVTGGTLGSLDPSLFGEGSYVLRLRALDAWAHEVSVTRAFTLTRVVPIGAERFGFRDLSLRFLGIPINVDRVYDSFARRDGAFGQNWALSMDNGARFEVPQRTGDGWRTASRCNPFNGIVPPVPTVPHTAVLRLGGRVYRADFRPTTTACWFYRYPTVRGHWVLLAPTYGATIEVDGEGRTLTLFDDNILYDADGPTPGMAPYQPRSARLMTGDGRSWTVDATQGLTAVRDGSGASLEFTSGALRVSGTSFLTIARDSAGHITAITRPDGSRRTYEYNAVGDLVASTDFGGGRYRYFYGPDHLLTRVLDPTGSVLREAEYDAFGRVLARGGAAGRSTVTRDPTGRTETRTDALGAVTVVTYNDRGLVTSLTNPAGDVVRDEYDPAGNRTAHTDALGNRDTWTYDTQGRVTRITRATGRVESITYESATGFLAAHEDGLGHSSRLTWNARGELATFTLPTGPSLAFGYDTGGALTRLTLPDRAEYVFARNAAGDVTSLTDPTGATRAFVYNATGDLERETVTSGGVTSVTRLGYHPDGTVTSVEGPTGTRATRVLDDDGRTTQVTDPFGAVTRVGYDSGDRVRSLSMPGGGSATNTYDAVGRLVSIEQPGGRRSGFTYDRAGRVGAIEQPDGRLVRFTYGPGGLVTTESDGVGRTFRFTHDRFGRRTAVTLPSGATVRYGYDTANRVSEVTDADGVLTRFERDALGRATRVTRGSSSTAVTYDLEGRPTAVTDPAGATTRYRYDGGGRLAEVTDPAGGVTRYAHDLRGLVSYTDALGRVLRVTRDAAGIPTARTLPGGGTERVVGDLARRSATQTYPDGRSVVRALDAAGRVVSERADDGTEVRLAYSDAGELSGFTDARGTTTLTRDRVGRLTGAVDPFGRVVRYTYNAAGLLTERSTASGTTRFEYDPSGLLAAVTDGAGRYVYTRDPAGRVTALRHPNNITEARTYDANGRLRSISARADSVTLFGETYTYDPAGRVTLVEGADGSTLRYAYDLLGRLTAETLTPSGGAPETRSYTYDAVGNLLTYTDRGMLRRFTYDADDQLTSDGEATYRYDSQGNLLEVVGGPRAATLRWDGLGRLVRVDTTGAALGRHRVDYQYDAAGLLVSRTLDGETRRFLWDHARPIPELLEETSPTGAMLARNVLAERPLARDVGGSLQHLHRDRLGSVRATTDTAGARRSTLRFTGFGEALGAGAPDPSQPYGFTGELFDPVLGSYYLRARHYAPRLGRFLSRDPATPSARDPRQWNRYAYALDAPTTYVDPTGRTALLEYAILLRELPASLHVMAQFNALSGYLLSLAGAALAGNAVSDFNHPPDAVMGGFSTQVQPSYYFLLSVYVGVELLGGLGVNGHPGYAADYTFTGWAVSGVTRQPTTFGAYAGFVWDAPYPPNYSGAFFSFSAPAGWVALLLGLRSGDMAMAALGGFLTAALGGSLQLTHFYSPSAGDEPRVVVTSGTLRGQVQAHGLAAGGTVGGAGPTDEWRTLLSPSNYLTFAWTEYSAPICAPGAPCN